MRTPGQDLRVFLCVLCGLGVLCVKTAFEYRDQGGHREKVADRIRIARGVIEAMLLHVRSEPAIECCGLLAGRGTPGAGCKITEILCAENAVRSATQYEIAPRELLRLHREMRERGLELMGIYHSHPRGENAPSATDIAKAYYPDVAYVILSPRPDASRPVRAFSIREGAISELEIAEI